MFILFTLVFMRMSGAVVFNPILGRTNYPRMAKGALIFVLSLMMYAGVGGTLTHQPANMLEYGVMLVKELMVGFVLGFSMEMTFAIVRFASAIMDNIMGLSMAQVYDPQYNTQMTITSGLYYAFLAMIFLAVDGHIRLIALFFTSARIIPFGEVVIRPELSELMLEIFRTNIVMGFQFAFPVVAMELVTEAAVGILMRMIPQINVFAVNFQVKIIVGLMMLVYLFSPMSARLYVMIDNMFLYMQRLLALMG
ncbi:MAG: flagellar biosynthetic protein FliR [Lachnospiraceae bacterium]|jgi:flagellar biosynthetic protein FliR|nr:flagellar biosynthetic protein FliR [Lachnospiraceae bacterium]MCI9282512.1 flagellar biosynthetic protein FliR [Lachnospiraceae bacterium]